MDLPHRFADEGLLRDALDVGSGAHRRLEWLGDRVLGCSVARMLYENHPQRDEGELTRAMGNLVNNRRLAAIGLGLSLPGSHVMETGGMQAANTVEALIGAVLLDGGMDAALECVRQIYGNLLTDPSQEIWDKDPKTILKEYCEAIRENLPEYLHSGPDEQGGYNATCKAVGVAEVGYGRTKAIAEALAASAVIALLGLETESEVGS